MAGVSNFPNGFPNGITLRGIPLLVSHPGRVFWVNNSSVLPVGGVGGSNGNPGTYQKPFSTIDYAVGRCTANRGDIIAVMPGHSESVTAAAGMTFDVAGIAIVGLGHGSLQPQISFTTAATADIDITAANTSFYNMRFTAGFADITAAIDISAVNHVAFEKCRFDESATNLNYVVVMNIADGGDWLYVNDCDYIGGDASNDHFIEAAGTHDNFQITNNRLSHLVAQTATVAMIESATDANNWLIEGNKFYTASAAVAAGCVVLTGTGNTGWAVNNYIKSVDTDATAANFTSAFDVTGLGLFETYAVADSDAPAVIFGTAEDLT